MTIIYLVILDISNVYILRAVDKVSQDRPFWLVEVA